MMGPVWKAPAELPIGELTALELREEDPGQPPLPRPGEERLGPLAVRSVEPLADGRGWRITVQPMAPGTTVLPALQLGDGRVAPPLRVTIPRTTPHGAPWVGVGGGQQDVLPYVPFPWEWSTVLLAPLALLAWLTLKAFSRSAPGRHRRAAQHRFAQHWPPAAGDRGSLDRAHARGRDLLALTFGEEARSWDPEAFRERHLEAWATWVASLDAARFSRSEPSFPPLADLLSALRAPREDR